MRAWILKIDHVCENVDSWSERATIKIYIILPEVAKVAPQIYSVLHLRRKAILVRFIICEKQYPTSAL